MSQYSQEPMEAATESLSLVESPWLPLEGFESEASKGHLIPLEAFIYQGKARAGRRKDRRGAMRRLRFSERMISRVTHLVRHHEDTANYDSSWDESAVRRLGRKVGVEHLELFFSLCRADLESQGKETGLQSELTKSVWSNVKAGFSVRFRELRVDGRKVMEICGIKEGPEVGQVLQALFEEVLDHPEWNTEEKLLKCLQEIKEDRIK